MTINQSAASLGTIIASSLAGISLWRYEIIEIKGWQGLRWLEGTLYSPYIGTLIAAFAFISPFLISRQATIKRAFLPIVILYIINILCFEAGKQLCCSLYCPYCGWTIKDVIVLSSTAIGLFLFLATAYWFLSDKFISKNKKVNIVFITLISISSVPVSLLIEPGLAETVKTGFPVFWMILMLGLSGLRIAKQTAKADQPVTGE